jgi:hypothetical protein
MGLEPDEHILVADDPVSFVHQVKRLYDDPIQWARQQEAGYRFVSDHYSWEAGTKAAEQILKTADEFWTRRRGLARKAQLDALLDAERGRMQSPPQVRPAGEGR